MQYRGLEADQKVIAIHGCYAMTATTALTAQNTLGVVDILYTPPEFVRKLIDACISDIGVDVVKTGIVTSEICLAIFNDVDNSHLKHSDIFKGMLASAETIKAVAESLQEHHVMTTVVDPVWISRDRHEFECF
jgi:hydroxymethylpyrimidine/phosphomethylpyrimidine kinase